MPDDYKVKPKSMSNWQGAAKEQWEKAWGSVGIDNARTS